MIRRIVTSVLVLGLAGAPAWAQKSGSILPGGNSKAPVSVDAQKLEYFDKEQKLVYSGNVVAKQGEATLKASNLVIFLNGGAMQAAGDGAGASNSQIKRMEAAGPVTIVSKDQVGTGDRGAYDRVENKVYLIGNVTLSQRGTVMKGSRLVYDLDSGQAQIVGPVSSLFATGGGEESPLSKKPDAKQSHPAKTP